MWLLLLGACGGVRADRAEGLVLNEILAVNTTTNSDEADQFDDWVEIYNGGEDPVDTEGVFLSDDPDAPGRWALETDGPIEPGGYLLVWCDAEPEQGATHATFKLAGGGETLVFSYIDGDEVIVLDQVDYGQQLPDMAWARLPDGSIEWVGQAPTPAASNGDG